MCDLSAGVQMIRVGLLAEKADIRYNPSVVSPDELVEFIKSLGFGAVLVETGNTNDGKIELSVSRVCIWVRLRACMLMCVQLRKCVSHCLLLFP